MNKKAAFLALSGTALLSLTIVAGSLSALKPGILNPGLGDTDSYSHSFTFNKDTEVDTARSLIERGPGSDDDIKYNLTFYHSSLEEYSGRTTPYHIGKHDGDDQYFIFCSDLQYEEGFILSIGLKNLKDFYFTYYFSDNDDRNSCKIIWEVSHYDPFSFEGLFSEPALWSNNIRIGPGAHDTIRWYRRDMTQTEYTYNYFTIKVKDNSYESTFRLNEIYACWQC